MTAKWHLFLCAVVEMTHYDTYNTSYDNYDDYEKMVRKDLCV